MGSVKKDTIIKVAETLCHLVEENNISIKDLALTTRISEDLLKEILRGEKDITLSTLTEIAYYLGANIEISMNKRAP